MFIPIPPSKSALRNSEGIRFRDDYIKNARRLIKSGFYYNTPSYARKLMSFFRDNSLFGIGKVYYEPAMRMSKNFGYGGVTEKITNKKQVVEFAPKNEVDRIRQIFLIAMDFQEPFDEPDENIVLTGSFGSSLRVKTYIHAHRAVFTYILFHELSHAEMMSNFWFADSEVRTSDLDPYYVYYTNLDEVYADWNAIRMFIKFLDTIDDPELKYEFVNAFVNELVGDPRVALAYWNFERLEKYFGVLRKKEFREHPINFLVDPYVAFDRIFRKHVGVPLTREAYSVQRFIVVAPAMKPGKAFPRNLIFYKIRESPGMSTLDEALFDLLLDEGTRDELENIFGSQFARKVIIIAKNLYKGTTKMYASSLKMFERFAKFEEGKYVARDDSIERYNELAIMFLKKNTRLGRKLLS